MDDEQIYRIKIGNTWFYHHEHCLDEEFRVNANNLTPERQALDRMAYEVARDVPDNMVCSICFQPVK